MTYLLLHFYEQRVPNRIYDYQGFEHNSTCIHSSFCILQYKQTPLRDFNFSLIKMSANLPTYLSIPLVSHSPTLWPEYPLICQTICSNFSESLSIHLFKCLFKCSSTYISICLHVYQFFCSSIFLSIYCSADLKSILLSIIDLILSICI